MNQSFVQTLSEIGTEIGRNAVTDAATGIDLGNDAKVVSDSIPETAAIAWALGQLPSARVQAVSAMPWAKLFALEHDGGNAYLKLVPPREAASLERAAAIAQRFGQQVPPVLALDAARGWLLSRDHGARPLDYDSDDEDILALTRAYARLQADAAGDSDLLASLPQFDRASLLDRLMAFLAPASTTHDLDEVVGPIRAEYFLGVEAAERYHRLLRRRLPLLAAHIAAAPALPQTLEHGDMRPPNAAIDAAGKCVIIDWDDAIAGPAGLSMHGLFSGCTLPTLLLSGSEIARAASQTSDGQRIHTYVDTLAEAGYADSATLEKALPAWICCGMIQFILNFARFPGDEGRLDVRQTMSNRLSDLLDLCDWLASRDRTVALELAEDYVVQGEGRRGQRLLQDQVARNPDDVTALARFASICCERNDLDLAAEAWTEALQRAPDDASLHAGLARVHMRKLDFDESERSLTKALALDATQVEARETLDRVNALRRMRTEALEPARMPTLAYSVEEAANGRAPAEKIALGAEMFVEHGVIQVDNAFPREMILKLQGEFMQRYEPYFRDAEHPDALRLGDKRFMLTVDMDELFGAPSLIDSPMLMPILRRIVGDDCVLGAYTAVISLPGSRDQRLHKDHPALFPDSEWHFRAPCFGAQIIVPLVPLDDLSGTTRFYKGTHRVPTEEAEQLTHQDPVVPLGSCLVTDYRCAHRRCRGNRSSVVRPILTLIYNRPWFRDFKNYAQQPPLRLTDAAYERLPDDTKELVGMVARRDARRRTRALAVAALGIAAIDAASVGAGPVIVGSNAPASTARTQ